MNLARLLIHIVSWSLRFEIVNVRDACGATRGESLMAFAVPPMPRHCGALLRYRYMNTTMGNAESSRL